jgi:hypothetical protein
MRALSSAELIELWEAGSALHPLDRALLVLAAAFPETPHEALADWPLGRRNRALAELRCHTFGPELQGWVACPRCGEKLEFAIDGRALLADAAGAQTPDRGPITVNGQAFRLPTSRDLARIAREASPEAAAVLLLEACRLDHEGPSRWTDEEIAAVGERLAQADPMAETLIGLRCVACGIEWEEALDIATFLWTEVEARARRLLLEVHVLASSYGWTEPEILALGERRRAFYLEAVRA